MLASQVKEKNDYQKKQEKKKKLPLGKNVKKALKDYLRDYKGHGDRPLFPSPSTEGGKRTISE